MRGLDPREVIGICETFVLDTGQQWRLEPFQVAIAEELCAGVREVWWETPEGNAKSTTAGGLALAHILLVHRGRVRLTSTAKDQVADAVLGQAAQIVEDTPGLANVLEHLPGYKRIACPEQKSEMAAWSASDATGEGLLPTLVIPDELHKLRDLRLVETWRGKLRKRAGQMLALSNAGEPGSPYEVAKEQQLTKCERVRRGPGWEVARGPAFVMHRHAVLDPSADVLDPEVVKQANPLSAITVQTLAEDLQAATFKLSRWRRMNCGIPIRDLDAAIPAELWDRVPFGEIPPDAIVDLSVDPARMWDCFAVVPIWFRSRTERLIGEPEILEAPRNGVDVIPTRHLKAALLRAGGRFAGVRQVTMDRAREGAVIGEWVESGDDDSPGWPVADISAGDVTQAQVRDRFMESIAEGWLRRPAACWVSKPADGWTPHRQASTPFDQHVTNAVDRPVGRDRYRFDRPSQVRSTPGMQDRRVIDALTAAANGVFHRAGDWDADADAEIDLSAYTHFARP
jgi:hypothetical protein